MKPDIRERWASRVEGAKSRAIYCLYDGVEFCALGHLAELHRIAHKGTWDKFYAGYSYLGKQAELADEVILWAGLRGRGSPLLDVDGRIHSVSMHSDMGTPRVLIAAAIRAGL